MDGQEDIQLMMEEDPLIKGDSTSEPYLVAHHLLLAHASAVRLYRQKYKAMQQGFVGINLLGFWFEPYTNNTRDVKAAHRANEFYLGWFLNPLVNGDYPEIIKKNAGNRIPTFTKFESERIKGSFDFFGLNHYSTLYVKDDSNSLENDVRDFIADMAVTYTYGNGNEVFPTQFPVIPLGLQKLLNYVKEEYKNPPIYIHENDAVRNGSNTKGYFVWSFLDLLELEGGYSTGYGMYYVDMDDKELIRYPKMSANWYTNFLKGKNMSAIIQNFMVKHSFFSSQ
ncbi:hypothetical protein L1887_22725 [Cichorium endivia]|nr:hypothetical protein L1887_22725 [Cichorium endivia]